MNPGFAALCLVLVAADPEPRAAEPQARNAYPGDPRQTAVELQLQDRHQEALQHTRREIREHPERATELGFHYLRGHLLDRLGRQGRAADAFAQAMGLDPRLSLHSRYRAALEHEEMGHPEMAAGLVATVVSSSTSGELVERAVRLFLRTLSAGGDCRLLLNVKPERLPQRESRYLRLAHARCALRERNREGLLRAHRLFLDLLREDVQDEVQREAAEGLTRIVPARAADLDPRRPHRSEAALIGLAFFQHRDFAQASRYLARTGMIFGSSLSEHEYELAYAQARSLFWQEQFDRAAQAFQWIAMKSEKDGEPKARAHYQEGRSLELAGRWRQAETSFLAAFKADPDGRWADAALFSLLRILWVTHQEEEAEKLYQRLLTRRSWRDIAARAALFLAASDLVRGRTDRAGPWLTQAARRPEARLEADYWRGRLEELEDRPVQAVEAYLEVLRRDLHHPLAEAARARLRQPRLASVARHRGLAASRTDENERLYEAWLLLGLDHPAGRGALDHLRRHLASDRATAPFLELQPLPVQRWPLWEKDLKDPGDALLALGDFALSADLVDDHFPLNDLTLGFTGSNLLALSGETRDSIRLAEILAHRIPDKLPEPLLPAAWRRLLHPLAHRPLLISEGARYGVDPLLMAAIIREESRFDAEALSAASARGLTQFVQPTAQRVAARIGRTGLAPRDVYHPPVAIELGAAYLQELTDRFRGAPKMAVAAYNAGEPQARLWRSYCQSSEAAEYFTKVGFRETRGYLTRVLGSYSRYRDLYADLLEPKDSATAATSP